MAGDEKAALLLALLPYVQQTIDLLQQNDTHKQVVAFASP
jgi:hypothetical protein